MMTTHTARRRPRIRRGFNLIELLIALAISAALLTATMVALHASYIAYQRTTREASTHTVSRMVMERILTLIRTGSLFGPAPLNPNDSIVTSDELYVVTIDDDGNERGYTIAWDSDTQALYIRLFNVDDGPDSPSASYLLLEGVVGTVDPDTGQFLPPFTLEYELGYILHRATVDLTVIPDDNQSVEIEGAEARTIRMVATAMPRRSAYDAQ